MYDVVVLTAKCFVDPKERNRYIDNVLLEDQIVMDALKTHKLNVTRRAWSDSDFDWSQTKCVLFRSPWDYVNRLTEFSKWLFEVSQKTQLVNSHDLLVWNLDKYYLQDLKRKGVNVVDTYFIESKDQRSLTKIHKKLGWEKTVLKPTVSAAAKNTFKLTLEDLPRYESRYTTLIENGSMMLQPFQDSVIRRGELSLMIIGGTYTHAVLKIAKPGDFRVQDDFGGTVHGYEPTKDEIALGIKAVNSCATKVNYARVDILEDNNGKPAISELELVEPELWFRRNRKAAKMLAKEVDSLLS